MHKHYIMDITGHSTVEFDPEDKVEIEEAMARFDDLVKNKKMRAAKMHANGPGQHELLKGFDPSVEETIFIPQLVGG